MRKFNKFYKKFGFVFMLFAEMIFAENIADFSLPSAINLNADRADVAISTKGNGQMRTFYNLANGANSTISGAYNYTLKSDDQSATFFINTLNLRNQNTNLNDFHTIAIENSINLNANSSLIITNSTQNINAQGSEYGGFPKVRFGENSRLILGEKSSLKVNNTYFFIHKGDISLKSGATLDISALSIRFEKSFTNDGASVNLTTGSSTSVKTGVYNVAYNAVAKFTQNSGSVVVNGDFYNGGTVLNDTSGSVIGFNQFDPSVQGGGDLILNGGTMEVKGKLISQSGGTEIYGGEIINAQNSSIKIYGATLTVGGGLQNLSGSTLIFGIGNNNTMGKVQGNVENSGSVSIDIKGMVLGQSYQIITGTTTGINSTNINLLGTNAEFLSLVYDNGSVKIEENGKLDDHKNSLESNKGGILAAISAKFDGNLLMSDLDIKNAILDTENSLKNSYIAQPKRLISAFKGDLLHAPTRVKPTAQRLAATEIIRFDNGKRVSPFVVKEQRDFFLSPIYAAFEDDGVDGNLMGLSLGMNFAQENFAQRVYFSYARGSSTQNLSTQSTEISAHLFDLGIASRYDLDIWEFDINANAIVGVFGVDNMWLESALNSSSNFNNYQANFGVSVGAKLGSKLVLKPFVGVQNYLEHQQGFEMSLGLLADSYTAYVLDGLLGFEARYFYDEGSAFSRLSFEKRLYNSHKLTFVRSGADELAFENESYDNALMLNLGTRLISYGDFGLDFEGFFKHYNTGLNYYGVNLVGKYRF